ncbi:hydroxyethylthiazole kinase [Bifidobacterium avesanii]|uniref:hydroxyethylthiazole kinase n=1 Tax=Bifidobacterium avesanii TaxID=1798157 RepID=UPI003B849A3D
MDDSAAGDPTAENSAEGGLPAADPIRERIAQAVRDVREQAPLAQSFTNFVTINLVANAQLAAGGVAAMSFLPDDVIGSMSISRADYVNVGTLQPFYREALPRIARAYHDAAHPWVLDPVAAGIGETRTAILAAFRETPPTIVRGNASEIIALADMWGLNAADTDGNATDAAPATSRHRPAGVESVDDVDAAAPAAEALARFLAANAPESRRRAAVAVSGPVDLVTDGERTFRLPGGSALMTKITGAGCSLGGVMATYLAVADPLIAALAASALYNRAGETAQRRAHGPGSFQVELLDALWNLTADEVAASPILPV